MQPPLPLEPIRQAVSAGEFDRAQSLWNECAAGLDEELSNNGCLCEARLADVRELVEWSRIVVLCARAQMLDQLKGLQAVLHAAGGYEMGVSAPAPCIVEVSL